MNKPTYGSQPIKNEQSGTAENNFSKSNVIICVCPKCSGQGVVSKPPYVPGDVDQCSSSSCAFVCDLCNGTKVFITSHYYTELSRILTAAKVSTVDEVVALFKQHLLSPEDIERAAQERYGDDMYLFAQQREGFIEALNFAKQPHPNEWVKCCERLPKDFTSVLVSDGNTRTTALYQDGLFYPDFLLEHQEVKYWMPLPHLPKK